MWSISKRDIVLNMERRKQWIWQIKFFLMISFALTLLALLLLHRFNMNLQYHEIPVKNSMTFTLNVSRNISDNHIGGRGVNSSTNVTTSKISDMQDVGGSMTERTEGQNGGKEFPWMPDPCAEPRRRSGVEDLLCMTPPVFLPDYKNPCYQDGPMLRCLPYFHLIGFPKSGTSDMFKRLHLHPDIVPNKGLFNKEIWYWSWRRLDIRSPMHPKSPLQGMTIGAFTEQFYSDQIRAVVDSKGYHPRITGHGDPMDSYDRQFDYQTPQNEPNAEELVWTTPYSVYHINPNVKLLVMLRDPVDRPLFSRREIFLVRLFEEYESFYTNPCVNVGVISCNRIPNCVIPYRARLYSHYFFRKAGTSAQEFHDHIVTSLDVWNKCLSGHSMRHCIYDNGIRKALKAPIYVSFYIIHLQEWLKVFPREQFLVFRNEDYTKDIKGTMSIIFKFLDVSSPNDALYSKMEGLPQFYATKAKAKAGQMKPETRKLLVDLYRPFTEELAKYLGDERYAFKDKSFG